MQLREKVRPSSTEDPLAVRGDGFYREPYRCYHLTPGVRSGHVREFMVSPAHYIAKCTGDVGKGDTDSMLRGKAFHSLVLEPEQFEKDYHVVPEGTDFRTTEGKKIKADCKASGLTPIKVELQIKLLNMATAVRNKLPWLMDWMSDGYRELSGYSHFKENGIPIKARFDILGVDETGRPAIADFKTANLYGATKEGWMRSMKSQRYDIQDALYSLVLEQLIGEAPTFTFVVVEDTAPFEVSCHVLEQSWRDAATRRLVSELLRIGECAKVSKWPGYDRDINVMERPPWFGDVEDRRLLTDRKQKLITLPGIWE